MKTGNRILLSAALLLGASQAQAQSDATRPGTTAPDNSGITPGRDGSSGIESRPADTSGTTPGTSAGGEPIRDGAPTTSAPGRRAHGTGSAAGQRSGSHDPVPADNDVRSGAVLPERAIPNGGTSPNAGAVTPDSGPLANPPRGRSAPTPNSTTAPATR